jgi:hypothetical protein
MSDSLHGLRSWGHGAGSSIDIKVVVGISELALALRRSRTRDLSKVSRGLLAVVAVHCSSWRTLTSWVGAGLDS